MPPHLLHSAQPAACSVSTPYLTDHNYEFNTDAHNGTFSSQQAKTGRSAGRACMSAMSDVDAVEALMASCIKL